MAKGNSVTFVNRDEDGVFSFHVVGGELVQVSSRGYATDDAVEIAYLDTVPFVKRAKKQASGEEE